MLKKLLNTLVLLAAVGASAHVMAEDCAIDYTRTACPGKEAESFKKCDGKANCVKEVAAADAKSCQALALKACANDRLDITKSKVIRAKFKGQALKSASGKEDFCADYDKRAAEFDHCGK
jgi:hypothetical protein